MTGHGPPQLLIEPMTSCINHSPWAETVNHAMRAEITGKSLIRQLSLRFFFRPR